jgi:hypothetical protein
MQSPYPCCQNTSSCCNRTAGETTDGCTLIALWAAQVVQVYTYMLSPLMVQPGVESGNKPRLPEQQGEQQQPGSGSQTGDVFGWQLRLVMEYCEKVGVLADCIRSAPLRWLEGCVCSALHLWLRRS